MTREEELFAKRLEDLSRRARERGIVTFSDFLNLNELNIFHSRSAKLQSGYEMWGGYENSERQMIAFLPDALMFPWNYPICCLNVSPRSKKFADQLTHRDVLGSLMNLGVDRSKLGDILLKEQEIYFFCQESISSYFMEELTRIRHTEVCVTNAEPEAMNLGPRLLEYTAVITTNRLDSLVASLCSLSRSQAADLIKGGKVFINNRETISTTYSCKEGQVISIRGYGRFRFDACTGETKKGRCKIRYQKYS